MRTPDKTNEIRAARTLLQRVDQRLDLGGKLVVLDALHTNAETARQIVQDLGADYLFTVKTNQKSLYPTVQKLLAAEAFFPSGQNPENPTAGNQPQSSRVPPTAAANHHP